MIFYLPNVIYTQTLMAPSTLKKLKLFVSYSNSFISASNCFSRSYVLYFIECHLLPCTSWNPAFGHSWNEENICLLREKIFVTAQLWKGHFNYLASLPLVYLKTIVCSAFHVKVLMPKNNTFSYYQGDSRNMFRTDSVCLKVKLL